MITALVFAISALIGLTIASFIHHRKESKYIEDLRGTITRLNIDIEELQLDVETYERAYRRTLRENEMLECKLKAVSTSGKESGCVKSIVSSFIEHLRG